MTPASSKVAATLAALTLTFVLSACGGDDGNASDGAADSASPSSPPESSSTSESSSPPSPASSAKGTTIEVTFKGDTVTPNGERVEVEHGQDVVLDITADKPGEIHVHSTPEQELEYDSGTSMVTITNLAQPGVVDVESHNLDQVIVQLEVR